MVGARDPSAAASVLTAALDGLLVQRLVGVEPPWAAIPEILVAAMSATDA